MLLTLSRQLVDQPLNRGACVGMMPVPPAETAHGPRPSRVHGYQRNEALKVIKQVFKIDIVTDDFHEHRRQSLDHPVTTWRLPLLVRGQRIEAQCGILLQTM